MRNFWSNVVSIPATVNCDWQWCTAPELSSGAVPVQLPPPSFSPSVGSLSLVTPSSYHSPAGVPWSRHIASSSCLGVWHGCEREMRARRCMTSSALLTLCFQPLTLQCCLHFPCRLISTLDLLRELLPHLALVSCDGVKLSSLFLQCLQEHANRLVSDERNYFLKTTSWRMSVAYPSWYGMWQMIGDSRNWHGITSIIKLTRGTSVWAKHTNGYTSRLCIQQKQQIGSVPIRKGPPLILVMLFLHLPWIACCTGLPSASAPPRFFASQPLDVSPAHPAHWSAPKNSRDISLASNTSVPWSAQYSTVFILPHFFLSIHQPCPSLVDAREWWCVPEAAVLSYPVPTHTYTEYKAIPSTIYPYIVVCIIQSRTIVIGSVPTGYHSIYQPSVLWENTEASPYLLLPPFDRQMFDEWCLVLPTQWWQVMHHVEDAQGIIRLITIPAAAQLLSSLTSSPSLVAKISRAPSFSQTQSAGEWSSYSCTGSNIDHV